MDSSQLPTSLLDLLQNTLLLHQLSSYLPIKSRLALSSVSKSYQAALDAPEVYRYVDLSRCKSAQVPSMLVDRGGINWRSQRMDESLTEDDVYCGPLRGIFYQLRRRNALQSIHTLVLDGLSVPADMVQEIMSDTNVRLLSLREAQHLNHRKLMQVLRYAARPSRPEGTPKLKGLYVFGPKEGAYPRGQASSITPALSATSGGVTASDGAQIGSSWNQKSQDALSTSLYCCEDRWYQPSGRIVKRSQELKEWADTLKMCEGIIAFDAVLCRGPRHDIDNFPPGTPEDPVQSELLLAPAIADVALGPSGCTTCKSVVEGAPRYGRAHTQHLPLLDPLPLHSAAVEEAQRPNVSGPSRYPPLYVRCSECLTGRWCERCFKWWCEDCWPSANTGMRTNEVRNVARAFDQLSLNSSMASKKSTDAPRVFLGLCIDSCLVSEEMNGSGSGGMWG